MTENFQTEILVSFFIKIHQFLAIQTYKGVSYVSFPLTTLVDLFATSIGKEEDIDMKGQLLDILGKAEHLFQMVFDNTHLKLIDIDLMPNHTKQKFLIDTRYPNLS